MRSTHNLKKSSSWFWCLLSKSADLSKPWGRFFQILCVRTLCVSCWTTTYVQIVFSSPPAPPDPSVLQWTVQRMFYINCIQYVYFCFEEWESMKLLIKCHNNRSRLNKFVFPSSNYFRKFALPILLMIHNICHIPEPDLNLYFHHIKQ